MVQAKILVLDAYDLIGSAVILALQDVGFVIIPTTDAAEGLRQVSVQEPDLMLMGTALGGERDWDVCRRLRSLTPVPLIVFAAQDLPAIRVRALEAGADECLAPFVNLQELVARVRALLRRQAILSKPDRRTLLRVGDLAVDLTSHDVTVHDRSVRLTPKEFRLLAFLLAHPGQVFSGEEILCNAWGRHCKHQLSHLKLYVCYLRKKIEDDPAKPRYIQSLRGFGYRMALPPDTPRRGTG